MLPQAMLRQARMATQQLLKVKVTSVRMEPQHRPLLLQPLRHT